VSSIRIPHEEWDAPTYYYAAEATPSVDSLGQAHWKQIGILFTDETMPVAAQADFLKLY
jgi:hypothetical protein